MSQETAGRLESLRSDYQSVCGAPFSYFYCPILFSDEDVSLCRAHIVNQAFRESSRVWTLQRQDVDNFYGRCFEADFVDVQYVSNWSPAEAITDPELSKRLRPKMTFGGEHVGHFVASGPVPRQFTPAVVGGPRRVVPIGLKIHPDQADTVMMKACQVVIEKDLRLPALVSLLKTAHLTLFHMLGYRYTLSPGGYFLGRTVLGEFFLGNRWKAKAGVLNDAGVHFRRFQSMVRPVGFAARAFRGTVSDGRLFVCECEDGTPWAFIVLVKTADDVAGVIVPIIDTPDSSARFDALLRCEGDELLTRGCLFEDERFLVAPQREELVWPKANWQ